MSIEEVIPQGHATYSCCGHVGPVVALSIHDATCPAITAERARDSMLNMVEEVDAKWSRIRKHIHAGSVPDASVWRELEGFYTVMHALIGESERLNNGFSR